MAFLILIQLTFRKYLKGFNRNKIAYILSLLSSAYLIFVTLFVSIKISPHLNLENILYLVFFYFVLGFGLRLFFQKINMDATEFIFLPINKSTLVHFMQIQNMFNIFNLIPILLFTPIFIAQLESPILYLLLLIFAIILVNWTVLFLKVINNPWVKPVVIIVLLGVVFSNFINTIDLFEIINQLNVIAVILIVILLLCLIYHLLFTFIYDRIFVLNNSLSVLSKSSFRFKNTFIGGLNTLEIKLILRSKRPLTYILLSPIFLFLGFQMGTFQQGAITPMDFVIFSFISVTIPLYYAQYLFSWESEYFAFILSNTKSNEYILTKYKLLIILFSLNVICMTPILFITNFNYYLLSLWLFHLGLMPFLFMIVTLNNNSPLKLSKGAFMNYDGTTLFTFILVLAPILPLLIYVPFYLLDYGILGMYSIAIIGILSILIRKKLVAVITGIFRKKKYLMYKGFKFN